MATKKKATPKPKPVIVEDSNELTPFEPGGEVRYRAGAGGDPSLIGAIIEGGAIKDDDGSYYGNIKVDFGAGAIWCQVRDLEPVSGQAAPVPVSDVSRETPARVSTICRWPIDLIDPNPWQPRRDFPEDEIEKMAASIRENSIINNPSARVDPNDSTRAQIIDGERRLRGARLAGLQYIELAIREASDLQMAVFALESNNEREDVNPIDTALAYKRLQDEFGMTPAQIGAQDKGKSRSTVSNLLRLLELPKEVQLDIKLKHLSEAHGRALLRYKEFPAFLTLLAKATIEDSISTKVLESGRLPMSFINQAVQKKLIVQIAWDLRAKAKEHYKKNPGTWLKCQYNDEIGYCLDLDLYKTLDAGMQEKRRREEEKRTAMLARSEEERKADAKGQRAATIAKNKAVRKAATESHERLRETISVAIVDDTKDYQAVQHAALVVACHHAIMEAGQDAAITVADRLYIKSSKFDAKKFFDWDYRGEERLQRQLAMLEALDDRTLSCFVAECVAEKELVSAKKNASEWYPFARYLLKSRGIEAEKFISEV